MPDQLVAPTHGVVSLGALGLSFGEGPSPFAPPLRRKPIKLGIIKLFAFFLRSSGCPRLDRLELGGNANRGSVFLFALF